MGLFDNTEPFGPQAGDTPTATPTTPTPVNPFTASPLATSYAKVPSNEHGAGSIISRAFDAVRANLAPNLELTAPHWPGTKPPRRSRSHRG
jgi:hypothetical protein